MAAVRRAFLGQSEEDPLTDSERDRVRLERQLELFELDFVLPGTVDEITRVVARHLARHLKTRISKLKVYKRRKQSEYSLTRMGFARTGCRTDC